MKLIKLNANLNPLLQPLPETAQENICGGSRPAGGGGGGGDIIVFDIVDSVAGSGGTHIPIKIMHNV
jgi:hypothetical protein